MRHSVVLGFAFGDEGKGVTTQWLCQQSLTHGRHPMVVRFNGGAQAAHTIVLDGEEHICSTYGSGVLLGVPTFLDKAFFFDPICAYNEYLALAAREPALWVHSDCRVVTPYDVLAGRSNQQVLRHGSCGKGIFQTFKRFNNQALRPLLPFKDEDKVFQYLKQARAYYGFDCEPELEALFAEAVRELPFRVAAGPEVLGYDELVFEGAQGLLLDMDYGFFPHVTPSHTGLDNLDEGSLRKADVYLVTRTYTTRHGNGYEPTYPLSWDLTGKHESNVENPYQGRFKTGPLDVDLLYKAVQRHHLDVWQTKYDLQYHLMVTHGDLVLQNEYMEYVFNKKLHRTAIRDLAGLKQLLVTLMEGAGVRFQSIKVNDSVESAYH